MPEILRHAGPDAAPRLLRGPNPVLDPVTAQVLEARVAEAEERGRRAGEAAAAGAASEVVERAAAGIGTRLEALLGELREQRAAVTAASLEMALAAATTVLERTPPDDATRVLERVREAVELLDDPTMQVRLHPDDHRALPAGSVGHGIELLPDPSIPRGDARIVGRHASAELTRQALVEAALEQLAGSGGGRVGVEARPPVSEDRT